jgi:hypothetical protein
VHVYSLFHVASRVGDFCPFIQIQNVSFRREMVKRGRVSPGFVETPKSTELEKFFYQLLELKEQMTM